jgi:hypothetical protein
VIFAKLIPHKERTRLTADTGVRKMDGKAFPEGPGGYRTVRLADRPPWIPHKTEVLICTVTRP